jgi:hypothetical protein
MSLLKLFNPVLLHSNTLGFIHDGDTIRAVVFITLLYYETVLHRLTPRLTQVDL